MNPLNLSRRQFLKNTGIVGGGLVIGFSLSGCSTPPWPIAEVEGGYSPNAFLQFTPDNAIRFFCPRDEMGQGVMTGLLTLIAEELDVDPQRFTLDFGSVHPDYNNPGMGVQATGGSNAMRAHYHQLRQVGADTRSLIVAAAAHDLGINKDQITTENGEILVDDERYPYSDFIATAAGMELPENSPLKAHSTFKYIGKDAPRVDALAKATGTAPFGIDARVDGMHHAVVRRSPVAGAMLVSVDKQTVLSMPGVTDVLEISSGVAVVAEKYWQAKTAAAALDPTWSEVALGEVSTETVKADYNAAMLKDEGISATSEGDAASAFTAASQVLEADYWTPFLAHAPLEPMNAVIRLGDNEAEIWTGNQSPVGVQGLVARFSGIEQDKIRVHNMYLGGGFGRRGTLTHIIEVTEIAKASGKPIKLTWSREDDIRHGLYRPASLIRMKAGLDEQGNIHAWQAKRAGGNISPDTLKNVFPALFPGLGDGTLNFLADLAEDVFASYLADPSSIEGLAEGYDLPNHDVQHFTVDHGLPLTFWRSVGHSNNAFPKEVMMDELAAAAGMDPVEFRLQNTKNNPRLQNVIRVAGERMQAMNPPEGHYLGFAAHGSFATDVAEIAEVSVENGKIRVHRVTCVVDCGLAVTPDVVRAQMEGGVMFALTAALSGRIDLRHGEVVQSNFHDYQILRMDEAPDIDVVIIRSEDDPTGVGEPSVPPLAPAVANAVFAATGQRLRSLPLELS